MKFKNGLMKRKKIISEKKITFNQKKCFHVLLDTILLKLY